MNPPPDPHAIRHATPHAIPRRRALAHIAGAGLASVLLPSCGRREAPVATGDEPRIVALSPAVAILLRDMGRQGQIVGRHGFDLVLDPAVPVCGDQAGIDYAALLRARPTHVITQWGTRDLPERLVALARDHGWGLLDLRLLTLDDIVEAVARIQTLLGAPGPDPAAGLGPTLEAAFAPRPRGADGRPRFADLGPILMVVGTRSISVLGPGSFHHQLLDRLGGVPAIAEGSPYVALSAEDAVRLQPRGIVLFLPRTRDESRSPADGEAPAFTIAPEDPRLGSLLVPTIPAIREGRVAIIDDPLGLIPSSSLRGVASALEDLLGRWSADPRGDAHPPAGG